MNDIKLSICIVTFNGEAYIRQQIESILDNVRGCNNYEIIICDDCSLDSTALIIKEFATCNPKINLLVNSKRLGLIKNIEYALNNAKGDLIFLSDQDDVWLSNKLQTFLIELAYQDLVISDAFITDSELKIIHDSYYGIIKPNSSILLNIYKSRYLGCCMAFRRSLLKYALPFPGNLDGHDLWLGLIARMLNFRISFISNKTLLYRRHMKNSSQFSSSRPILIIFYKRIFLIINLLFWSILHLNKLLLRKKS